MGNSKKWTIAGWYIVLLALLAVGIKGVLFFVDAAASQAKPVPQTTVIGPVVEARLVEMKTIQYVDRPVTVVEHVERVEKVTVSLRNFNDLDELRQWVAGLNVTTNTVYLQNPEITLDCDDFALTLQDRALDDGYRMSFQIIETDRYNTLFQNTKMPPDTLHAINLAIIGNEAYYIEPQTGEIVLAAYLD
ncbi:MAG: hypothetical protein ABIH70_04610 [Chloroflexota bacterium]